MASPRRGFYKSWSDDQANDFVNKLLEVLSKGDLQGSAYAVSVDAHRTISKSKSIPRIEEICLVFLFATILSQYPTGELCFVFDRGDRFAGLADRFRNKFSESFRRRIVKIEPVAADTCPAVQSADLSAWYARTHWVRSPESFPIPRFVEVIRAVNYQYSIRFEHDELGKFDIESLWEKLKG